MNFLAHLLLSYPDREEMAGNFMGDFVKGRAWETYPEKIKNGILIHRAIDHYTDQHPAARELTAQLKPVYKRYSGVMTDFLFDHILAISFSDYCALSLKAFTEYTYNALNLSREHLPERVAFIAERIRDSQRFQLYATVDGLLSSVEIMTRHTSLPDHTKELKAFMLNHREEMERIFTLFFPQLQRHVVDVRQKLENQQPIF